MHLQLGRLQFPAAGAICELPSGNQPLQRMHHTGFISESERLQDVRRRRRNGACLVMSVHEIEDRLLEFRHEAMCSFEHIIPQVEIIHNPRSN